jgi:hypothetical protein
MTPEERFWSKVDITDGCWLWTGYVDKLGYARFWVDRETRVFVHRFAYESKIGPIPEGLTIDHLCRVPRCVNPDHLDPVTLRENLRRSPINPTSINLRKTRCPQGHRYSNYDKRGWRECRTCRATQARQRRAEVSA